MAMPGPTFHPGREMSSVEAIWAVRFGWVEAEEQDWEGGVLALFSNRMVGGDSVMAYVGNYATDGDQISGQMTIMRHNLPEDGKAHYKDHELRFEVALEATLTNDEIVGRLIRPGRADAKLAMRRFAPLPATRPD
jgi:hypothetical protein